MAQEVRRFAAVDAAAIDDAIVCTAAALLLLLLLEHVWTRAAAVVQEQSRARARDGNMRAEAVLLGRRKHRRIADDC
jgi:hypothetical protein